MRQGQEVPGLAAFSKAREKGLYFDCLCCLDDVAFSGGRPVKRLSACLAVGALLAMGHPLHSLAGDGRARHSAVMEEPSHGKAFCAAGLSCCAVVPLAGGSSRYDSGSEPFPPGKMGLAAASFVPESPPPEGAARLF